MSRKTRKLIWSAPLVAVLAVVGALAMFVMLAPDGVQAHEPGANTAPHQPPNPVTGIEVTTPTAEEGGRTSLRVTWNAPEGGEDPTMYRVDISTDARIWHNSIGGELSTDTLMKSDAESACTTDDAEDSCHTVDNLQSDMTYHFRVFAMNYFGTSPISVDETIVSGKTLAVDPPDQLTGLMATDYHDEKIVLYWDEPVDTGGAPVVWYCLAIAASPSGPFANLADVDSTTDLVAHEATPAEVCRDAAEATDYDDVMEAVNALAAGTETDPVVIVVDSEDGPMYEHEELSAPDVIALRYRVYAVTDDNGDMAGGRRVARAASNTATGRTIALPDDETERPASPGAPENLRGVAFATTYSDGTDADDPTDDTVTGDVLYFYWNHPEGFSTETDDVANNDIPQPWDSSGPGSDREC